MLSTVIYSPGKVAKNKSSTISEVAINIYKIIFLKFWQMDIQKTGFLLKFVGS